MRKAASILLSLLVLTGPLAAADELVPGDNLVSSGLPALSTTLAENSARYTEFRTASLFGWHPTRRELLISTRFGDTNQVHAVRTPLGARSQLTFFADRVAAARFSPAPTAGDYFVFNKDSGGNEFAQNYRFDLTSGRVTLLTDGKSKNTLGVFSTKGDRLAYTSTRRNGKDTDIYVVDPRRPDSDRRVAEVTSGGWDVLDWSPDDKQLLVQEYVSIEQSALWLVDVASGNRRLLTPKTDGKVSYADARFGADGRTVYAGTDRGSEFLKLIAIDTSTGAQSPVASPQWDVEEFAVSPDGKRLAYVTNEDGIARLHLLDLTTGKALAVPQPGDGVISDLEWHPRGRDLGFSFASARAPGDVYSLDTTTGKLVRWTASETGGVDPNSFAEPKLVRWKSFDSRTISGFLYEPPDRFTGRRPVIINIHGGPESQYRPGYLGRTNYHINELGVAVLFPNVRGSSGYGKTFLSLDNGEKREDSVRDIGALLDWIKTQPNLDPERVMVTGGSYGGYMTLAVATRYNDRIRCSLDVVGISNFVTFLERTESYRRDLRRAEYGDERDPKMRELLTTISPLTNASKITKPLFVVQGQNDPRVPRFESEQMVATIQKNGTPVWFLMAKDEGHGFRKKKNVDFQFYATLAFVQRYLLGS